MDSPASPAQSAETSVWGSFSMGYLLPFNPVGRHDRKTPPREPPNSGKNRRRGVSFFKAEGRREVRRAAGVGGESGVGVAGGGGPPGRGVAAGMEWGGQPETPKSTKKSLLPQARHEQEVRRPAHPRSPSRPPASTAALLPRAPRLARRPLRIPRVRWRISGRFGACVCCARVCPVGVRG